MARPRHAQRPARPSPICEDCGSEVMHAWSLTGKCWIPLDPSRYPLESVTGTFEVWRDQHGGLLATYLAPGERGIRQGSWRGLHHNVGCGTWRVDVTRALVRESRLALPHMSVMELLALAQQLEDLGSQMAKHLAEHDKQEEREDD